MFDEPFNSFIYYLAGVLLVGFFLFWLIYSAMPPDMGSARWCKERGHLSIAQIAQYYNIEDRQAKSLKQRCLMSRSK